MIFRLLLLSSLVIISTWTHECRLEQFDQISLRAHLSASVIEATALERFKYIKPSIGVRGSRSSSDVGKPYSVLFQIKRIFKYENRLYDHASLSNSATVKSEEGKIQNQTYFYVSAQNEQSDEVNLNSFFMVENFVPTSPHSSSQHHQNDSDCKTVGIQLNRNYFLFIDAQDTSVKLNERRVFTYPIR